MKVNSTIPLRDLSSSNEDDAPSRRLWIRWKSFLSTKGFKNFTTFRDAILKLTSCPDSCSACAMASNARSASREKLLQARNSSRFSAKKLAIISRCFLIEIGRYWQYLIAELVFVQHHASDYYQGWRLAEYGGKKRSRSLTASHAVVSRLRVLRLCPFFFLFDRMKSSRQLS